MKYAEYKPGEPLKAYIDAYYTLETGALYQPVTRRIFADGCTEIFINIGTSKPSVNGVTILLPGNVYLGGTMTASNVVSSVPNSRFVGIRFKPSGFSAFYNLPLDELVDEIIELPDPELYLLAELDAQLTARLNHFFIRKLKISRYEVIIPITKTIEQLKGVVSVDNIAQAHNVSTRTLERIFSKYIGIPPKEFIKIIRFQHAAKKLQHNATGNNLLRIATDMGYYDHAHFTREIKKYSGLNPSELAGRPS